MRLTRPRLAALSDEALPQEAQPIIAQMAERGPVGNVFRTLAASPKALVGFLGYGRYVLSSQNDMILRERQMVILRIGYLCRSGYEWASHARAVLDPRVGLEPADLDRIKAGPDAAGWSARDRAVMRATDELHRDQFISDAVWAELGEHLTDKQRLDLVLTAGHYTQVCMILNTFGVQLEDGLTLDPDLKGF